MSNDEIEKENKQKKILICVNFSNSWSGSWTGSTIYEKKYETQSSANQILNNKIEKEY